MTSSKKNAKLVQNFVTLRGCGLLGCVCNVCDSVCQAEGFDLLLAGCFYQTQSALYRISNLKVDRILI